MIWLVTNFSHLIFLEFQVRSPLCSRKNNKYRFTCSKKLRIFALRCVEGAIFFAFLLLRLRLRSVIMPLKRNPAAPKKTPAPKATRVRGGRAAAAAKATSDTDPDDSSSAAVSSTPKTSAASRYGIRGAVDVNRDADEVPLVIDEGWSFFDFPCFSMFLRSFPVNSNEFSKSKFIFVYK